MTLNNESKTLFIPLYGKALMSKKDLFLKDLKAEEIINKIDYDFTKLKQSKWLSMYMSLRGLIIDELTNKYLSNNKNTTVIHLGCGLDSRCLRIKDNYKIWYDLDYEEVIKVRKEFYKENDKYKMIGSSVLDYDWLDNIDENNNILIIMEGLTMYLSRTEIIELISKIDNKFKNVHFIFDAYTNKAVRASKYKNPVNQMNAKIKYGIDNYKEFLKINNRLEFVNSYVIRKNDNKLEGMTKIIFNKLYCGKLSERLYMIYEFKMKEE
ncbi:MAG: class I SAM-dependent methyltransferase [Bacilli bacterium]|nr:class I SAM-dependent methyltransferase [Bacilli bacterium]